MEKSETHRRDLSNMVEELMLICDTSEKELNKLVCTEQVSHSYHHWVDGSKLVLVM